MLFYCSHIGEHKPEYIHHLEEGAAEDMAKPFKRMSMTIGINNTKV